MIKFSVAAAVASVVLSASAWAAETITLTKDGQPVATIVVAKSSVGVAAELADVWVPQPAPNKIAAAAKDLQTYVEKMTGAKLPIVADDSSPTGTLVLVGRSALTKDLDGKIPSGVTPTREEEGYTILSQDNRLLLAGNDESVYHGTEYAVAAFLHRQGVRWYMPGDFGEFVPKKPTITVGALNIVSRPDFKMRNWWGTMPADMVLKEARWKIRNGMNPMFEFIAMPSDTSVRNVLPPADQLNNKEFADVWGKDTQGNPYRGIPDLTSRKSVEYAANKVKEYFRAHPKVTSFGLGGDDGYGRDCSETTLKRSLGFPDTLDQNGVSYMSMTEEWMEWIQAVAKEVYKEFPDHIITTNGYANRNMPPIGITPDPKIWIMFAAIWCDTMHACDNPRSWQALCKGQMIKNWSSMYKNVFMYDYMYYMLAGCGAPIPLAHRHMHDMPLFKKWGMVGFGNEGRTVRGESGIFPTYLYARMMWDANLDAKTLMDEFFANWYGPAAAPAKAFWEELENTFETTPWLGHEDRILPYVYSDELLRKLEEDIQEAERLAAQDDLVKKHVLADRVTLEELKAFMAMSKAEFAADFTEAAKQAQRMVEVRKAATALSRFYFDPNPTTGESSGYYYWGAVARRDYYKTLADMTTGKTGDMIAILPEKTKFMTDPRDGGRYWHWYMPDFKDDDWQSILTTEPFYAQAPGCRDAQGFPYMGVIWYRMNVDVPAAAAGKNVSLYVPAIETEAWVWVNGKFIGHREYHDAYERPNPIDMDVTGAIEAGKNNSVVIRIHTAFNAAQQSGGMTSRAFLYAPKPSAAK